VVVTRSEAQSAALGERLEALGAVPVVFPVIRFEALPTPELEEIAARDFADIDWIVLTSVNAVEHLCSRLERGGRSLARARSRVAAIGEATMRALAERGVEPQVVPDEFRGEALVESLGELEGKVVLLPRSRLGRPEIAAALRARGARVRELALYDTVRVAPRPEALRELRRGFDAVTFTSPSSVRSFLGILEGAGLKRDLLDGVVIACIGPVTAEEARSRGLVADVVPASYTVSGLVAALAARFDADPRRASPGRTAGHAPATGGRSS
jgi:uroporphyrinogen III methyltransferase/synthase